MREHLILLALVLAALVATFRRMLRPLIEFSERVAQRRPGSLDQLDADAVPRELLPAIAASNGYVVRLDRTVFAYEGLALALGLLQIGIALAAITVLTRGRQLLWGTAASALLP